MYRFNNLDRHGMLLKGILKACKLTRRLSKTTATDYVIIYFDEDGDELTPKYYKENQRILDVLDTSIFWVATFKPLTMQQIADMVSDKLIMIYGGGK